MSGASGPSPAAGPTGPRSTSRGPTGYPATGPHKPGAGVRAAENALNALVAEATTVRRVHAMVSAALHQAEWWDMVEANVARRATPPPVHAAEVKARSPDEVRALITGAEKLEPMLAALLLISALTGARRGEICALRWSDVDTEAGRLRISGSIYTVAGGGVGEKGTKTHQVRTISLDPLALETLRRHRADVDDLADRLDLDVPDDAFVFSRSPQGAEPVHPDLVTRFVKKAAAAAGLDGVHLHTLRHFSATQLIAGGVDVRTAANRLGHRDASVTLRVYSHAIEAQDKDAAALLGRTLALPAPTRSPVP